MDSHIFFKTHKNIGYTVPLLSYNDSFNFCEDIIYYSEIMV